MPAHLSDMSRATTTWVIVTTGTPLFPLLARQRISLEHAGNALLRRRSGDTCLPRLFALLVAEGLVRVHVSRVRGPGVLIQVAAAS